MMLQQLFLGVADVVAFVVVVCAANEDDDDDDDDDAIFAAHHACGTIAIVFISFVDVSLSISVLHFILTLCFPL